jgi:hypothetical protein
MMVNIVDMTDMEIRQPGYTEKRRAKAAVLKSFLRQNNMQAEVAILEASFPEENR